MALRPLLVLILIASSTSLAAAQSGMRGTVNAEAPVYIVPDATRVPLRMLSAGTPVVVGEVQGDWLQITFEDPQFGRRTGWIQRRFVAVSSTPASPEPSTIPPSPGVPKPTARPPAPREAPAPQVTARGRMRSGPEPSARGFVSFASEQIESPESFRAITGSDRMRYVGGGIQGVNLWKGLFAEFGVDVTKTDGERVFVFERQVFKLGIPVEVRMTGIDLVGGWRLPTFARLTPYAGGGATWVRYKETSDFAEDDENVDERFGGSILMAGVEVKAANWIHVRGEVRYRNVPDALGTGGVSAEFDESKLGGFAGGLKIVVGR